MLKALALLGLSITLLTGTLAAQQGTCPKQTKADLKNKLDGYLYDAARYTPFNHDERDLQVEFVVNLFSASVYNLVFDAENIPPSAIIKVYELDGSPKKRTLVWSSDTAQLSSNQTYNCPIRDGQRKKMMVQYYVPARSLPGCIVFILGFKTNAEFQKAKRKRYVIQ